MRIKDRYFLTEAVYRDRDGLIQVGIHLNPDTQYLGREGIYDPIRHLNWIESCRLKCAQFSWMGKGEELAGRIIISVEKNPRYTFEVLNGLLSDLSDEDLKEQELAEEEPTPRCPFDNAEDLLYYAFEHIKDPLQEWERVVLNRKPVLKWFNKRELQIISLRIEELSPRRDNPLLDALYEFNMLSKHVIEAWFDRNNLTITLLEAIPDKWTRFCGLVNKALKAQNPTDEELWRLKLRFKEFPTSYFNRHEERYGSLQQGKGSGNGLEWRANDKFRKPRTRTSK